MYEAISHYFLAIKEEEAEEESYFSHISYSAALWWTGDWFIGTRPLT